MSANNLCVGATFVNSHLKIDVTMVFKISHWRNFCLKITAMSSSASVKVFQKIESTKKLTWKSFVLYCSSFIIIDAPVPALWKIFLPTKVWIFFVTDVFHCWKFPSKFEFLLIFVVIGLPICQLHTTVSTHSIRIFGVLLLRYLLSWLPSNYSCDGKLISSEVIMSLIALAQAASVANETPCCPAPAEKLLVDVDGGNEKHSCSSNTTNAGQTIGSGVAGIA